MLDVDLDLDRLARTQNPECSLSFKKADFHQTPMKPSKDPKKFLRSFHQGTGRPNGFALIVTLSLMILLTIIAVGLLTLSSISLRSSSQGDAMQIARANAKMAMMLALGDLQKQLGPDTRVSMLADQLSERPGSSTALWEPKVIPEQRQWMGAYDAWAAANPNAARPNPSFLQWFVSGNPEQITKQEFALSALPTDEATLTNRIVNLGTVGEQGLNVRVPLISQNLPNNTKNRYAWWVADLGMRALVNPAKDSPGDLAQTRMDMQSLPGIDFRSAAVGAIKPFESVSMTDSRTKNLPSWQTAGLLTTSPKDTRALFHDLTTHSRGLMTNVRKGGFRQDLSFYLEALPYQAPNDALYVVGTEPGINMEELSTYYTLPSALVRGSSQPAAYTTGGSVPGGTRYLSLLGSPAATRGDPQKPATGDYYYYYKQPCIISYQVALSFRTRTVTVTVNNQQVERNRLQLVVDPIVTYWNPLDVPVALTAGSAGAFNSVKFWQLPYDLNLKVGTRQVGVSFSRLLGGSADHYITLRAGMTQRLVLKPGEVLKISQTAGTRPTPYNPGLNFFDGAAGFNYGGGLAFDIRDQSNQFVDLTNQDLFTYTITPNSRTSGGPNGNAHSRHFSITHHEFYVGHDRTQEGDTLGVGGMFVDFDFGNKRLLRGTPLRAINTQGTKPTSSRMLAVNHPGIFGGVTSSQGRELPGKLVQKAPVMLYSYNVKTEKGGTRGGKFLSRFNPKAFHVDFYDLSQRELDLIPYELDVEALDSWKSNSLEQSNGNGYFGGGMNAIFGTSFITTHSVPREPIVSLAAFQHSFANGFPNQRPRYEYATLNPREPMLPQISHAIGNSFAPSVIAMDKTEDSLPGGRPIADHSYLANQALWDDWFLSGIAPQTVNTFTSSRNHQKVAEDFLKKDSTFKSLPVKNFVPYFGDRTPSQALAILFSGPTPKADAHKKSGAMIHVDGMFNVNSTSVEAWKALLRATKERPIVTRDLNGAEKSTAAKPGEIPVGNVGTPLDLISKGSQALNESPQWTGRRTLSDAEIDDLAKAIVSEVRKRGPFLSLADFVNRRVGNDPELARSGAVQAALENIQHVKINENHLTGDRKVDNGVASRFAFPAAEEGSAAQGIPGIVKQADILTPIAPVLSARSDTFLIRAYGEKTDSSGKAIAKAWCEATIQRTPDFVDPVDAFDKEDYSTISAVNKKFGRKFSIVSFRWLNASEV